MSVLDSKLFRRFVFIWQTFGVMILYYVLARLYSERVALIFTVAYTALEIIIGKLLRRDLGKLFYFVSFLTIALGAVDLYVGGTQFIRWEPVVGNLVMAGVFGYLAFAPTPLIAEIARKSGKWDGELDPDRRWFFQIMTLAWVVHFVLKSIVFGWLALQEKDLSEWFWTRMALGNGSFFLMLGLSFFGARPLANLLRAKGMFPSQRKS